MSKTNFERMLQLADTVFAVKNDPDQLDVNQEVLEAIENIRKENPKSGYRSTFSHANETVEAGYYKG